MKKLSIISLTTLALISIFTTAFIVLSGNMLNKDIKINESAPRNSTKESDSIEKENSEKPKQESSDKTSKSPSVDSILSSILTSAEDGKIINCDFKVKYNVIDDVEKQWGKEDKSDYVSLAKGTYFTYDTKNVVFGCNKGMQLFEIRSFDETLKNITLDDTIKSFGEPQYEILTDNNEKIIGYKITEELKILFVFKAPTDAIPNPSINHYSVLYPQGTVNSMSGDSGREW